MKRVIFMGRTGCGKTTLCQKLDALEIKYKKTQTVEVYNRAIDTPGEYLENRNYYSALIMTAVDADIIALIGDPTAANNFIPPAFACSFAKEIIGIITKINLVKDKKQLESVRQSLKEAGVSKIFEIDTVDEVGLEELFEYLEKVLESSKKIIPIIKDSVRKK